MLSNSFFCIENQPKSCYQLHHQHTHYHLILIEPASPVESDSGDGNHAFYGIGIDGKINETIKYRVEFERMSLGDGDNMNNIGVGLLFGF
jgi:hypothetical protein